MLWQYILIHIHKLGAEKKTNKAHPTAYGMGCLHNQLLLLVSQKNSYYRLNTQRGGTHLLGSSHTSALSLTSQRHFTSVRKPENSDEFMEESIKQGWYNLLSWKLLQVWQEHERNKRSTPISGSASHYILFILSTIFPAPPPALQTTFRDQTLDQRPISPSKSNSGMRSGNLQASHILYSSFSLRTSRKAVS